MAIANAVGSNVLDILLGLGVPWLIAGLTKGAQPVDKSGIEVGVIILWGTVLLFVGTIALFKFKMHSTLGWVFLFAYVMYIAFTILSEACVISWKAKCLVVVNSTSNLTNGN
jgi:Ca2+/Na+ antiporter